MSASDLIRRACKPCEGGVAPLSPQETKDLQRQTPAWTVAEDNGKITRTVKFRNFTEVMAFVNRVAELAERDNHHPDMGVHYSRVELELSTHAIGGLSENDFILAAKIDALLP